MVVEVDMLKYFGKILHIIINVWWSNLNSMMPLPAYSEVSDGTSRSSGVVMWLNCATAGRIWREDCLDTRVAFDMRCGNGTDLSPAARWLLVDDSDHFPADAVTQASSTHWWRSQKASSSKPFDLRFCHTFPRSRINLHAQIIIKSLKTLWEV